MPSLSTIIGISDLILSTVLTVTHTNTRPQPVIDRPHSSCRYLQAGEPTPTQEFTTNCGPSLTDNTSKLAFHLTLIACQLCPCRLIDLSGTCRRAVCAFIRSFAYLMGPVQQTMINHHYWISHFFLMLFSRPMFEPLFSLFPIYSMLTMLIAFDTWHWHVGDRRHSNDT